LERCTVAALAEDQQANASGCERMRIIPGTPLGD
jgi:hypothetical protein